jgi:drug/metabolite transporter (DMT)-like permease
MTAAAPIPVQRYSERRAILWVAFGASLWGTDTVFRRPLTASLPSARIVLLEHLILAVALLIPLWRIRSQWLRLGGRQWTALVGIAWGGSALGGICFTEAIRAGNPNTAILLQKTQPIFAALLAWLLLAEPLGKRFWSCLAGALCGAYLVSFGFAWPGAPIGSRAALLALGAAALWGGSTALGRFALATLSPFALTSLRIILATPPLLLLNPATVAAAPLTGREILSLLWMALIPGLVALLAYYQGLRNARASRAAIAELSFPATGVLLNWIFLGAGISVAQLAGFALLWAAILNLNQRSRESHLTLA